LRAILAYPVQRPPTGMRTDKSAPLAVIACVIAATGCGGLLSDDDGPGPGTLPAGDPAVLARAPGAAARVENEVLVSWVPGATAAGKSAARARAGGVHQETIHTQPMKDAGVGEIEVIVLPAAVTVDAALQALGADPNVAGVEPNYLYQHTVTANDTYATNGSLWGMYGDAPELAQKNTFGSKAAERWATYGADCAQYTDAAGNPLPQKRDVYVGIIDEGYMFAHPDLAANVGTNTNEIAGNGIDDDGNGYVDDVYGWDFDKNDATVFDGAGDDHGTHVAGTIAAVGGNGAGVAGVCWTGIKLLNAKFLGRRGGTTANAIKAIDYFIDLKRRGFNIVALNNSWGGGGFSGALQAAIDRADASGILFVAAAGNESNNNDASAAYPAAYPNKNIISVAALTSTGGLASYSNYGQQTVDIGAPGSSIWSTVPVSKRGLLAADYASYSGTSMATPHVTGAAAMYAGRHPGATADQIKAAILASAVPTPSLAGKTVTGGRLNVSEF
jgi:subtilisin family serine protease